MTAREHDLTDLNGRQVHEFALEMHNLGLARVGERLLSMLESDAWQEFSDGLGNYRFLDGEFDYFLTQQGVERDHVMHGVQNVDVKARLETAMDERRTGEEGYRRRLAEARSHNPKRPGRPIVPFGYTLSESQLLLEEGVSARKTARPALGTSVRRWTNTGGKTTKAPSDQLPLLDRLTRSAARLSDEDLRMLSEALRAELLRRQEGRASSAS
jgi:hypothetical protein